MTRKVFNPTIRSYPHALDDLLFGHQLCDETIASLEAINESVDIENAEDWQDDEYMAVFCTGGLTHNVLRLSLKIIRRKEPARITLKVIEIYHLDSYFAIDDLIKELQVAADAEMLEINNKLHLA
ncbi:hypothetical protein [Photobacterium kishitanii]|uniref:Uncharacterized protein n=1 Tax=Photobacterium kishitanii TaxID=318456 RepID=A0A2T3KAZ9_9GAMM|nr:hypothetical protein [Photobacterium kishitanii]PSU89788.1 hypothetical protein C9J27_24205 [Photobacterium kishitanii]